MNTLVLVAGRKRTGKNTLVNNIIEGHEDKFNVLSFADPIKETLVYACNKNGIPLTLNDFNGFGIERDKPLNDPKFTDSLIIDILETAIEYNNIVFTNTFSMPTMEIFEERSIRSLMRTFGTYLVVDQYDKNFWINKLQDKLVFDKINIVDDLRQQTEYEWALRKKAIIIKTERNDLVKSLDIVEEFVDKMNVNYIVSGTLEETKKQAKIIKEQLWNLN